MRLLLTILLCLSASLAWGNEVDDRGGRVSYLARESVRLAGERQALARVYADKVAGVASLKAQPASWARDRKLQGLLAESKDMAARLDRTDGELRGISDALLAERRALIGAIDRELATTPPPDAARAADLARRRGELVAVVSGKPLHVPEWTIEDDDDAEDLAYKAAALAQGERALLAEETRLSARVTYFRKQAKLSKSRARAAEQDVFGDEPRHGTPGSKGARDNGAGAESAPPGPTSPATNGNGTGTGTPVGDSTGFGQPGATVDPRSVDLAADPSVVLADIVAAGTLDELRRAERSGDPETMARAAERAGQEVSARVTRLRQLRQEMEQRAQKLRGEQRQ